MESYQHSEKSQALLQAALKYAELGWFIFPLKERSKEPLISDWPNKASCDPAQIKSWWSKWPNANIGLVCGKSGIVVVDVDDTDKWLEIQSILDRPEEASRTRTAKTQRGFHTYYKANGVPIRCGRLYDGIDIKGEGGYVVLPPSIHPKGHEYYWCSEIEMKVIPEDFTPIPQGMRNQTLASIAGRLRNQGMSASEIEERLQKINKVRCRPPLDEREVARIAGSIARYEPKSTRTRESSKPKSDVTDLKLASILAEKWAEKYRYQSNDKDWYVYDKKTNTWRPTDEDVVKYDIMTTLRDMFEGIDDKAVEVVSSHSKAQRVASVLRAMEVIHTQASDWNNNHWKLNVKNGILDLKDPNNPVLKPHSPFFLETMQANVEFNRELVDKKDFGEEWPAFLDRCLPDKDVQRQFQRDIGLTLVGKILDQTLPILYGLGSNGKSTTIAIIREVLGSYTTSANASTFTEERSSNGHSESLARLKGKRMVVLEEPVLNGPISESKVKLLVSGEPIVARKIFGSEFEFTPGFRIFMITNQKPTIKGVNNGVWRRIRLLPWEQTFPHNRKRYLDDDIKELVRKEGANILAWAICGLQDFINDPSWVSPKVSEAIKEYQADSDPLHDFIQARCVVAPNAKVQSSVLYKAYYEWCEENKIHALSSTAFSMRLQERGGIEKSRTNKAKIFIGIGLKDETYQEPPVENVVKEAPAQKAPETKPVVKPQEPLKQKPCPECGHAMTEDKGHRVKGLTKYSCKRCWWTEFVDENIRS